MALDIEFGQVNRPRIEPGRHICPDLQFGDVHLILVADHLHGLVDDPREPIHRPHIVLHHHVKCIPLLSCDRAAGADKLQKPLQGEVVGRDVTGIVREGYVLVGHGEWAIVQSQAFHRQVPAGIFDRDVIDTIVVGELHIHAGIVDGGGPDHRIAIELNQAGVVLDDHIALNGIAGLDIDPPGVFDDQVLLKGIVAQFDKVDEWAEPHNIVHGDPGQGAAGAGNTLHDELVRYVGSGIAVD